MTQKLLTNLTMTINKGLSLDASVLNNKFIVQEPEPDEEPKMVILVKPNNSESMELF